MVDQSKVRRKRWQRLASAYQIVLPLSIVCTAISILHASLTGSKAALPVALVALAGRIIHQQTIVMALKPQHNRCITRDNKIRLGANVRKEHIHTHARARAPLSIHWSYTAIEPVSSVTQSITRFQLTKSILRRLRMYACIWSVDSSTSVYWMHATYGKVFFPFSFVRVAALHLELALVS
jgi:hypothetical protein